MEKKNKKTRGKVVTSERRRHEFLEKFLNQGLLECFSSILGAKIRVFKQNTDIIKFWLFYSVTAHEYSI